MKILYLSPWFPFPPTNGSELRINALVRGLAAKHQVSLLAFHRRPINEDGLRHAQELMDDVQLVPWREFDPHSRRARLALLGPRPRSVVDTYSSEMAEKIKQNVATNKFDVIICSQLTMANYQRSYNRLPALFEELELGVYYQAAHEPSRIMESARRRLAWAKMRTHVRKLLPYFAAVTVVSHQERTLLDEVAPDYRSVELIPNGVNLSEYTGIRPIRDPNTIIFTGAFTYNVNYEAMCWFLDNVYPLVRQECPDARLIITGDHAGKPLPPAENITLTGYIPDVKTVIAGAAISIAPIQSGGGTRLKILEAMALGTPVVSTTKGAEGLGGVDGFDLLIADTPENFAGAIIRLLDDVELRQNLVKNACQLIQRKYDWNIIMPEFLELVERVASGERMTVTENPVIPKPLTIARS